MAHMGTPIFSVTPGYGDHQLRKFHYSQVVRYGDRVETAGQGGWDEHWRYSKSVRDQVVQAFDNVERTLATAGASWRDVVHVHSYHLPAADGQAIRTDTGLRLNGMIPWSTGADHADFIVAGARVQDGNPVIFVLPTDRPGLRINAALPLATLSAAHTSSIECRDVQIESHLLLAGPSSDAMTARKRSVHVSQAFAALGLIRGALELIAQVKHGSASTALESLNQQYRELRHSVHALNARTDDHDLQSGPLIRSELNNLALRATHAAVTVHKGSSLRLDHPAQRLAREALFLLVWSSPMSVVDRNLELMSEPI